MRKHFISQVVAPLKNPRLIQTQSLLQVMYMYYLLGYRLLGQQDESFNNSSTLERDEKWKSTSNHFVKGNLFKYIPERVLVQVKDWI